MLKLINTYEIYLALVVMYELYLMPTQRINSHLIYGYQSLTIEMGQNAPFSQIQESLSCLFLYSDAKSSQIKKN